jgi:hypothetical protein
MATIELDDFESARLVSYLQALSDILTAQHEEQHSGIDRMLTMSMIQEVDRLAVDIRDQLGHPDPDENTVHYDYSREGIL